MQKLIEDLIDWIFHIFEVVLGFTAGLFLILLVIFLILF